MICPRPPITGHPELKHVWWQDIGSYAARWVWDPGGTAWRCDRIAVRQSFWLGGFYIEDHYTVEVKEDTNSSIVVSAATEVAAALTTGAAKMRSS